MAERAVISIDGMGGDHAPVSIVDGLERFAKSRADFHFLLHGDEARLKPLLAKCPSASPRTVIRHAEKIIAMDAKPAEAVRRGKGSSMWNAIEAVKSGEAVSAISAGNTGALMAMSKLILRTVEGIHRPALIAKWPTLSGFAAVLDLGADIAADAEQLVEFAIMGQAFARAVLHKEKPTVGLLNIGSEELKGREELREAARLIRESGIDMDFRGFVEGNDISAGAVDVVVTDGFTGNVALKTAEGMARMIYQLLRSYLGSSMLGKIGAAIAMPALKAFGQRLDPSAVNGAVLLGLNGVVVKSHGGADAFGFERAISVAGDMGASHFRKELSDQLSRLVAAASQPKAAVEAGANEETAK